MDAGPATCLRSASAKASRNSAPRSAAKGGGLVQTCFGSPILITAATKKDSTTEETCQLPAAIQTGRTVLGRAEVAVAAWRCSLPCFTSSKGSITVADG
jgi:hypothetical protein